MASLRHPAERSGLADGTGPWLNTNSNYWKLDTYSEMEGTGTYTYEGGVLTVTNANGLEMTDDGDPMALHYVTSVSDQLTGDFTISAADLGA